MLPQCTLFALLLVGAGTLTARKALLRDIPSQRTLPKNLTALRQLGATPFCRIVSQIALIFLIKIRKIHALVTFLCYTLK